MCEIIKNRDNIVSVGTDDINRRWDWFSMLFLCVTILAPRYKIAHASNLRWYLTHMLPSCVLSELFLQNDFDVSGVYCNKLKYWTGNYWWNITGNRFNQLLWYIDSVSFRVSGCLISYKFDFDNINPWTIWPKCCRWHFEMHFC